MITKSSMNNKTKKQNQMKTLLLSLSIVCITFAAICQNSIPNGSFEIWNSTTYDNLQNYPFTSNASLYSQIGTFNATKTADSYQGSAAIKLTTISKL